MKFEGLTMNQLAERNAVLVQELEKAREVTNCPNGVDLQDHLKALVAESLALKNAAEFSTAPDMWIEQADGMLDYRYVEWYVDVLKAAMETPATDSIMRTAEARGVERFAAVQRGVAERLQNRCGDVADHSIKFCLESAEEAEDFAKQLREGKAE